jgi:hypothetical protein
MDSIAIVLTGCDAPLGATQSPLRIEYAPLCPHRKPPLNPHQYIVDFAQPLISVRLLPGIFTAGVQRKVYR